MVDLQSYLGHHQGAIFEEQVIGLEYAAGLRVLDRDQRKINGLVGDAVKGVPKRSEGLGRGRRESGVEGLFRVGARFPLITDRDFAGDAETLLGSLL